MVEATSLHDRITRLFLRALNLDIPSVHTDLFDTGALDSLAFVELLVQLEQEFGVTTSVDELELDNFRSIARIADFLMARAAVATTGSPPPVVELGTSR